MNLAYPFDPSLLLRKKNRIRRELLENGNFQQKRIAVLGGSTTSELVDQLELFLLANGVQPEFYQSEYGQYYEDAMFPGEELQSFKPDIVYVHTSSINIKQFPSVKDSREDVKSLLDAQIEYFRAIWQGIEKNLSCPIVQNNFDQYWQRPLGNLDGSDYRGRSRFIGQLNEAFANEAESVSNLYIHDIHYLSARVGIDQWFNPRLWYLYKYAMDLDVIPCLAHHLGAVIASVWGVTHKALVLDLDNTMWGGVIGDDGLEGIRIGSETAEDEAYTELQRYAQELKQRGIVLAVCSKNEDENARMGFTHPDSVLSVDDFTAFRANWEPKSMNMEAIAGEINLGIDSLVFIDDNPAERDIIRSQLPSVSVPEVGSDITDFVRILDRSLLFESVSLSTEDLARSQQYSENAKRVKEQSQYASYDDFLKSLEMTAEIAEFQPLFMDRITQLTNKTNQFNLTTRRYTRAEIEQVAGDDKAIALYGRLEDKFGDNGLISVVIGAVRPEQADTLHIDLWLMSCRVLKRGMEYAMLERLIQMARERGITRLLGYYLPTAKNKMVAGLYADFGFSQVSETEEQTVWELDLAGDQANTKHHIDVSNTSS